MGNPRTLGLLGAPNARDLGGLPTRDGRKVREGVLLRSGALGRLVDDDLPRLAQWGPTMLVDLRGEGEIAQAPPNRLPVPQPMIRSLPIFDPSFSMFTYVSALLQGDNPSGGRADIAADSAAAMVGIYEWFVAGETARRSFAEACRTWADPANLPGLFHCQVGKDRTGWLAVILLTVLGVDEEVIRADYLHTNDATAHVQQRLLELLAERRPHADPAAIRPVLQARATYLDAAYAEVQRRYGSFDGYLRDGLGLDDETLTALRTNLLS